MERRQSLKHKWLKFNIDPRSAGKATIIVTAEPNTTSSCRLASLSISGVNPWYPLRLDIWQAAVPDSTPSGALNIGPFPKEPDKAKNLPPPTTAQGGAAAVAQPKRSKPTESPSPDSAMAKGASSGAGGTVSNAQEHHGPEEPGGAALTNKQVLELLSIGISPEIVIAKIRKSECQFDTSVEALKELKNAKAPEEVILAMLGISKPTTAPRDSGSVKAPTVDASATTNTAIEPSHRQAKPANPDLLSLASAGDKPLKRNTRIFIEEMEGDLDGFIRAEMIKRKVPMEILLSPEGADYILTGNLVIQEKRAWHEGWLSPEKDHNVANVMVVDPKEKRMLWAAEAGDRSWFWGSMRGEGSEKLRSVSLIT